MIRTPFGRCSESSSGSDESDAVQVKLFDDEDIAGNATTPPASATSCQDRPSLEQPPKNNPEPRFKTREEQAVHDILASGTVPAENASDIPEETGGDSRRPDQPDNPTIEVDDETEESSDTVRMVPSAKSASKSSLGAFFHQKLFRSASATSSNAPTSSSSCHSSPETKCVDPPDEPVYLIQASNRISAPVATILTVVNLLVNLSTDLID
jgi:hypothetical protein